MTTSQVRPYWIKMSCCPKRDPVDGVSVEARFRSVGLDRADRVRLEGGQFMMGTNDRLLPADGESPARRARLRPFEIDRCAVTNARFAKFVADTGYVTEAERFGWSYVFFNLLDHPENYAAIPGLNWWRKVDGARWNAPEGPGSSTDERMDHPVVQVSWNDAMAFASWAGGRLPTEAEWEYAALGGQSNARFPWGNAEPDDDTFMPCNIWQGDFPRLNTAADGYLGTAPAQSFAPNGYGLYNMAGNTWEWNADPFRIKTVSKALRARNDEARETGARVLKGGSYLCHRSYCYRYRIAARSSNTPDTTLGHTGFRLCYDVARDTG